MLSAVSGTRLVVVGSEADAAFGIFGLGVMSSLTVDLIVSVKGGYCTCTPELLTSITLL